MKPPMCATRLLRISAANIGPNRFHQNRTVSWLMSIPRSARRSSTLRSDSGYLTYIITTRRMTSGELLKYRNGLVMSQTITTEAAQNSSDKAERHLRSLHQEAGAQGERSAQAVKVFTEKQPLVALIIAVGIGYVGVRVLRR